VRYFGMVVPRHRLARCKRQHQSLHVSTLHNPFTSRTTQSSTLRPSLHRFLPPTCESSKQVDYLPGLDCDIGWQSRRPCLNQHASRSRSGVYTEAWREGTPREEPGTGQDSPVPFLPLGGHPWRGAGGDPPPMARAEGEFPPLGGER